MSCAKSHRPRARRQTATRRRGQWRERAGPREARGDVIDEDAAAIVDAGPGSRLLRALAHLSQQERLQAPEQRIATGFAAERRCVAIGCGQITLTRSNAVIGLRLACAGDHPERQRAQSRRARPPSTSSKQHFVSSSWRAPDTEASRQGVLACEFRSASSRRDDACSHPRLLGVLTAARRRPSVASSPFLQATAEVPLSHRKAACVARGGRAPIYQRTLSCPSEVHPTRPSGDAESGSRNHRVTTPSAASISGIPRSGSPG